jgi:hypothetical protein
MEELQKYKKWGSFKFHQGSKPAECFRECNAPSDESGVYVIYAVKDGKESLVYIGISGRLKDGKFLHRKDGIRGRLIVGKYTYPDTSARVTRYKFFNEMIEMFKYDHLKIDWFTTYSLDEEYMDIPRYIEDRLIKKYNPAWNN